MPPITLHRSRELFNLANAKVCCPSNPAAPCIPFHYPDDGCWGRAHEMCRVMIAAGEQPRKIWIAGALNVASRNRPDCRVTWGWHVAPTVEVAVGGGSSIYVIDPSLFDGPVPQATWVTIQNAPGASITHTGPEIFHNFYAPDRFDPMYVKSDGVLATYRNELMLRSAEPGGPPPYTNCMTRGPGVQWFGSIGPNASRRWFTYGWPARWHVIWTIMPLTPCPGGPQLSWQVAVERASQDQCTYWITVQNLTRDTVKFEGRYDVLSR